MPIYEVTSPEGKIYEVTAPDGATKDDAIRYVQATFSTKPNKAPNPAKEVGPIQAGFISAGGALDKLAAGLKQGVRATLSQRTVDAIEGLGKRMGMADASSIETPYQTGEADRLMAPLESARPVATFIGSAAPSLAVANPAGMAVMAGLDYGSPGERLGRAVLAFGAGKAGQWVGGKHGGILGNKAETSVAEKALAQGNNAVRDATLAEAKAAGYVIPPTQANPEAPGLVNRVLEGISGKIQTAQSASIKNQAITNALAKKELGLPESVPLTRGNIRAVREVAGQFYKQLKEFGPVTVDDPFKADIGKVIGEYQSLINDFPSQANKQIESLLTDINKPQFNSGPVVELVKRLRSDGFSNIINMDPEKKALGRVQLGTQSALEDLIDRNLTATGNDAFLQAFRNARAMIAKSYTVEKALYKSSGKVVAGKIGREFSNGKPLSGNLETIGKVAEMYPKAVQNVGDSMPGLSPLDVMGGIMTGAAVGHPLAVAAPLARPVIRAGLLSGPYQQAMVNAPSYGPSLADSLMAKAGDNPELMRRLGGLLGLGALKANQ
jgi:hypothetical protein